MRHHFVFAALAALAAACGSNTTPPPSAAPPSHACTTLGCANGLHVGLAPAERWPAGRYRVDIEADGVVQSCEAVLPLRPCDAGPSVHCSGASVATIGESGCALPPTEHGLSEVTFLGAPKQVHLRVSRDGASIADKELTPSYQRQQPNGPECEPVCNSASATVVLSL